MASLALRQAPWRSNRLPKRAWMKRVANVPSHQGWTQAPGSEACLPAARTKRGPSTARRLGGKVSGAAGHKGWSCDPEPPTKALRLTAEATRTTGHQGWSGEPEPAVEKARLNPYLCSDSSAPPAAALGDTSSSASRCVTAVAPLFLKRGALRGSIARHACARFVRARTSPVQCVCAVPACTRASAQNPCVPRASARNPCTPRAGVRNQCARVACTQHADSFSNHSSCTWQRECVQSASADFCEESHADLCEESHAECSTVQDCCTDLSANARPHTVLFAEESANTPAREVLFADELDAQICAEIRAAQFNAMRASSTRDC